MEVTDSLIANVPVRTKLLQTLVAAVGLGLFGCSGAQSAAPPLGVGDEQGVAGAAATESGGAAGMGTTTAGGALNTAGTGVGGNATGGNATGGSSTGGNATGGSSSGGNATGGMAAGGSTAGSTSGISKLCHDYHSRKRMHATRGIRQPLHRSLGADASDE